MDYSNAAAAAVLQSIGTPETETTDSSAIAALESALQQNRAPVAHALHNSLTVANNKRNGTEVSQQVLSQVPYCSLLTVDNVNFADLMGMYHVLADHPPSCGCCHCQHWQHREGTLLPAQP